MHNKYTTANTACLSERGVLLLGARDGDVVRATVMDSLEGPRVAVTVRLEVFWSQYGTGLKHLHEHHVTHHPEQTCTDDKNFTTSQEIRHRCMCPPETLLLGTADTHFTVYQSNPEEPQASLVSQAGQRMLPLNWVSNESTPTYLKTYTNLMSLNAS